MLEFFTPEGDILPFESWPHNLVFQGSTFDRYEVKMRRKDTGKCWFASYGGTQVYGPSGDVMVAIVTMRDITEQKIAEETLKETERNYRELIRNAPAGIYEIDFRNGRFTAVNDAICHMLGYAREELLATNPADLLYDEGKKKFFDRVKAWNAGEELEKNVEYKVKTNYGHDIDVVLNLTVNADKNGKPFNATVVAHDITTRKQMEEQLRELNITLEQRVRERTAEVQQQADQLRALATELTQTEQRERKHLAGILHDHVQQLLVAARMQVEWLLRDDRPERMKGAAQGVHAILREAIDASRDLSVSLSPPVLHEAGLIGGLNWLATRLKEKNQFTVHLRADNQAEPATEERRFLLFESARELLFNTIKHAGVSEASVALTRTDDIIKLVVSDQGKGFEPDVLRKRKPEETTFGLFSIQQRLTHVGGKMEIQTAPGKGTTTVLTVPYTPRNVTEDLPESTKKFELRRKSDLLSVLIVDDHKIMRQGLTGMLQFETDIEVVGEAASAEEALQAAAELQPDVIIMDVNLGTGMNGIEVTRRILAEYPHICIIALSIYIEDDIANAMRDAGAKAYLNKGGQPEDLLNAIRSCRQ